VGCVPRCSVGVFHRRRLEAACFRQGIGLLEQFARDNRIRIRQPHRQHAEETHSPLTNGNELWPISIAIGLLDGAKRLLEWKTTRARYPEQPEVYIT